MTKEFNPYSDKPYPKLLSPQEYLPGHTVTKQYTISNGGEIFNIPEGHFLKIDVEIDDGYVDSITVSECIDKKRRNPNYEKELKKYELDQAKYKADLKEYNKKLAIYNKKQIQKTKEARYKQFLRLKKEFANKESEENK